MFASFRLLFIAAVDIYGLIGLAYDSAHGNFFLLISSMVLLCAHVCVRAPLPFANLFWPFNFCICVHDMIFARVIEWTCGHRITRECVIYKNRSPLSIKMSHCHSFSDSLLYIYSYNTCLTAKTKQICSFICESTSIEFNFRSIFSPRRLSLVVGDNVIYILT